MLSPTEPPAHAPAPAWFEELLPRWRELPLYRARLTRLAHARNGDAGLAGFLQLPLVTKRDMREGFPGNFLRPGQALETLLAEERVELEHTSGTSEERTPVLLGRGWWLEQEARALRLNRHVAGLLAQQPQARRVWLTTPVCNGTVCHSRWTPRAARIQGDALSVNQARIPFVLEEAELARMAGETRDWAPLFLDLDPVHGAWFALHCERRGIRFPSLRFILCSYEFLSVVHRRILERVFAVPVLNLYGSTETGHLLMEDERGALRPSLQTAFLEIVDADPAGVGDLVVTTLSNEYMPLLRYRIGDLVARLHDDGAARYVVHGRARDALRDGQGRRATTWQVDRCFDGLAGFAHYQLRQEENGDCLLRYVVEGDGPRTEDLKELRARLAALLGPQVPLAMEPVSVIAPAPSGKFRLTCPA